MSLDPAALRLERERAAVVDKQTPPLEPPFPYGKKYFDPFFFGLDAEPPEPKKPGPLDGPL